MKRSPSDEYVTVVKKAPEMTAGRAPIVKHCEEPATLGYAPGPARTGCGRRSRDEHTALLLSRGRRGNGGAGAGRGFCFSGPPL